jgi:peroxin-6
MLNSQPRDPAHVYPITPQYYLGEMATDDDTNITVSREDFLAALRELVPSVSQTEMEHYRLVQQKFAENTEQPGDQEGSRDNLSLLEDEADVDLAPVKGDRKGKGRAL